MASRWRVLGWLALSAAAIGGLARCAVNPATGQGNVVLMSENREKEIGAEEHQKVLDSMPLYDDPDLLAYVRRVGNAVAAVSHRPDLEYQFNIIDNPDINAFALPGGYVYINRGLLTFINSEAQLAAVLGHEIGHITARHAVQQQARAGLAKTAATVGGFVTAVATGSGYVGSQVSQVASIWAATGISGFGRELELQADSLGAEYLYEAGYDPEAVIDVITILKNQEDFNRRIGNGGGSYHGLFATHPRNDTRLQEAVRSVGQLSRDQLREVDETEFRTHVDGLIVGQSAASMTREERNRYYQHLLGYTLVFPDDWSVAETTTTVRATSSENHVLSVEAQRLQENIEPRVFIRDRLGIEDLQKSEPLSQYRLLGHTGVTVRSDGTPERIAVIYMTGRAYILRGSASSSDEMEREQIDTQLLNAIRTFRPIQRGEAVPGTEARIRYVQVGPNFNWKALASQSKIANYPEETLRLLNGYYPSGNPKEGDWVKVVE